MAGPAENENALGLHAEFASVRPLRIARAVRVNWITRTRFEDIAVELARETVSAERIKRGAFVTSCRRSARRTA